MTLGTKSTNTDAYLWIGATGAAWSDLGNWADTTTSTNPAAFVPGTLTPVTITGTTSGTPKSITGSGSASRIGLTGSIGLSGSIAVSGPMYVGSDVAVSASSTTLTAGGLYVAGTAVITATLLDVVDGTLDLAAGASVTTSLGIVLGTASGRNVAFGGTYATTGDASGNASLAAGSSLWTDGDLVIAEGVLTDTGGQVHVGGQLTVGTVATSTASLPYSSFAAGQVVVLAGGTISVGGGISDPGGVMVVAGANSKLVAGGTLTLSNTGLYLYTGGGGISALAGSLVTNDGGVAQVGGVVLNAPGSGAFSFLTEGLFVDATSAIEIGARGGAALGAITVDGGNLITVNTSATLGGALIDNGTVVVNGATLTQTGNVSGGGQLSIGTAATLLLGGSVASTNTIVFQGSSSTLSIGSNGTRPYAVAATISGFQTGDSIVVADAITTASYTVGGGGLPGTLVLADASGTVETLSLIGDFTGKTFFVSPNGASSTAISLIVQQTGSGSPSPNADAYAWIAPGSGAWGGLGNWRDSTTSTSPAPYVPGAQTAVTIAGPGGSGVDVISGGGTAASLAVTGNVSLTGAYNVSGALAVGSQTIPASGSTTSLTAGALAVSGVASLSVGSVNVVDGMLSLGSGTTMAVTATSTLQLGTPGGTYVPSNGSYLTTAGATGTLSVASGARLTTAAGLSINSGTLSDAGGTISLAGTLTVGSAPNGGTTTPYSYGQSGSVLISAGGTLDIVGSLVDPNGNITVDGSGSRLTATGALSTQGAGTTNNIAATNGGLIRLAGASFAITPGLGNAASQYLVVDTLSSIEIGTVGGAAAGAITVDAGRTITANASATLLGALVDNGSVVVNAGTLIQAGSVTGGGSLQIGTGATLQLNGSVSASNSIAFTGTGATLEIGNPGTSTTTPFAVAAAITGFQSGDSIALNVAVTSAVYTAATGLLVLGTASGTVETLQISGALTGQAFAISSVAGGSSIGLVPQAVMTGAAYTWSSHALVAGAAVATSIGTSGTTDINGSYSVLAASSGSMGLTVTRGISDIGRAITAADALAALKIAAGINPNGISAATGTAPLVSPYQFMAADMNGDGKVTAADALAILKIAAAAPGSLTPSWEFASDQTNYWNSATNSFSVSRTSVPTSFALSGSVGGADNLVAVLVGDVNGSWAPQDGSGNTLSSYPTQAASGFGTLSAVVGAPTDQWGIASYTAAGAVAATGTATAPLSVVDSAANTASQLDGLQALASAGHLAGVWLNDLGSGTLAVTSTQLTTDAQAIASIHGSFTETVTASDTGISLPAAGQGSSSAFLSAEITPALTVSGTPSFVNGSDGAIVNAALAGAVTEVQGFSFGLSILALDLGQVPAAGLEAVDVTLGGVNAIYLTASSDVSHGVVLVAPAFNASDLMSHVSYAGHQALIG